MTVGALLGFLYLYVVHKCKFQKLGRAKFDFKHIKKVLRLSFPLTLASVLTSSVNILDLSMIMNGLAGEGYSYVVASVLYGNYTTLTVPMIGLATALISPFTTSMQPILTKNYACQDNESAEINLKSCFRSVAFVTVPISVIFLGFSGDILSVVFEKESAILAAPTLSLISPSLYFLGVSTVINMSLESDGKTVVPMFSLAFGAILKLIVGLILINTTELGILSAPIGTAISYFGTFLFSFSYYKFYQTNKATPFCGFALPFFISAFSFVIILFLKNLFNINVGDRFSTLVLLAVYGTIYLLFSLILSKKMNFKSTNESKMHKKINA